MPHHHPKHSREPFGPAVHELLDRLFFVSVDKESLAAKMRGESSSDRSATVLFSVHIRLLSFTKITPPTAHQRTKFGLQDARVRAIRSLRVDGEPVE